MDLLKNKKYVYILIGCIVIIISVITCVIIESNDEKKNTLSTDQSFTNLSNNEIEDNKEENEIVVHIAGEVKIPGIIRIKEGSRIIDVIEKAGGYTDQADTEKVNLAYEVKDEQKIVIPNINQKDDKSKIIDDDKTYIKDNGNSSSSKVNINTATQSEFESLTGIGPSMASKILDYREKNGKFKSIEELKNVPGIGSSKFESIKDEICIK